ncbi:HHL030Wp [Eremothecium sinecaudum]|uniref:HHL030Wp n=1 Tax=Eremothecium sinecaudum TaxID=45286 RepID=A0A109V0C7_9SACH|nr:HHL030Wp [Eremothecium sinecaudum]AMD22740.1 HHL030Wp [Eremothecium sinecaudum]
MDSFFYTLEHCLSARQAKVSDDDITETSRPVVRSEGTTIVVTEPTDAVAGSELELEDEQMAAALEGLVEIFQEDIANRDLHIRFIQDYMGILNTQLDLDLGVPMRYLECMLRPLREVINRAEETRAAFVSRNTRQNLVILNDENNPPWG